MPSPRWEPSHEGSPLREAIAYPVRSALYATKSTNPPMYALVCGCILEKKSSWSLSGRSYRPMVPIALSVLSVIDRHSVGDLTIKI